MMTVPYEDYLELCGAIFQAIKAGDYIGLLTLLRAAEGKNVDVWSACYRGGSVAILYGDTECLRVLDIWGFEHNDLTWLAASLGHVHCLAFAVSAGYVLSDYALEQAIQNGQMASVDFLIQHGGPWKPYKHPGGRVDAGMMKCMQLLADRGVDIDPLSMKAAVECGDLDFVRWLHRHGVPLWKHALDELEPTTQRLWFIKHMPEKLLISPKHGEWRACGVPCAMGQCMALRSLPLWRGCLIPSDRGRSPCSHASKSWSGRERPPCRRLSFKRSLYLPTWRFVRLCGPSPAESLPHSLGGEDVL